MTSRLLANYQEEQTLFSTLVQDDTGPHILLLQGESGSGKSYLIEHCLNLAPDIPSHLLKLQSKGDLIPTVFTGMGGRHGWEHLPYFSRRVANLLEVPGQAEDPVWQRGMHRHLREIGKLGDVESRLSRYQLLSDAWFADAEQFETPFLLAIDGYEAASTVFDRWFRRDFLMGVAYSRHMRVVVAGQSVPEQQEGWGFCASLQELAGIDRAKEWLAWAEAAGYQVPSLDWLAGVVAALKGNPSQINEMIKQLPQKGDGVNPKGTVPLQRRRIRQNMIDAFSLSELKDICFDLEIRHENLPDHDHLSGFVRELLAYAGRIGRMNELVRMCRAERPRLEW